MAFARLGDKFPQELKKARERDALGIEVKTTKDLQNTRKTGDKSSETESTVSQPPREGDTNMGINENTESKKYQDPTDRVADAIYAAVEQGVKVVPVTIDQTALQGAAVGCAIGSLAAGLSVGFGMKTATPGLVLGSTVAGGGAGALFGAAIAKTIW